MSEFFASLGIAAWKPLLTALLLPPVPFLLLIVVGARLILPRRGWGWLLVMLGVAGIWSSACLGTGEWLTRVLLQPPAALSAARIAELSAGPARGRRGASPTIVVLGGGRESQAPEYGLPSLKPATLARLRYGLWLSRRTGAPVGFTGGVGWAQAPGPSEAEIAARIAADEFRQPLAWTESASRDTRGNAAGTVALLRHAKVAEAVLVTHAWHMPRALRLFDAAADGSIRFVAAPIGLARGDNPAFDWLPTAEGYELVRNATREALARWADG